MSKELLTSGHSVSNGTDKDPLQEYYYLISQAPFEVAILRGRDFVIEMANDAALAVWNRSREEVIGLPILTALAHINIHVFYNILTEVYITGNPFTASEMPFTITQNNHTETQYVSFSYTPMRDLNGNVFAILCSGSNVTELVTERQKREAKEQQIHQERQNFYKLLMQSPGIMGVLKGPEHRFELANTLLQQVVGFNRDVLGKTIREAVPELEAQGFVQLLDQVYQTGKPVVGEEQLVQLDKQGNGELEDRFFNFVYQPIKDEEGLSEGILVHAVDVTEQVRTRKVIEESEQRFRTLIENAKDIITLNDARGYYTYVSPAIKSVMGYTEEELLGKPWFHFIHPDHIPTLIADNYLLRQPGHSLTYQLRFQHKDTTWHWVETQITNMTHIPYIGAYVCNFQDITLQRNAQEFLEQSEERLRQLANLVPQIIWTAATDGTVDYFNDRWYEFTGFEPDSTGTSWINILHPDDVEHCLAAWKYSIQTGHFYQVEYRFKDRIQGGYRWFLGKALPIKDAEGTIIRWFGSCTDIDDQKQWTEELERLVQLRTEELQRSNDDLQQFAHVTSHDLKEPLRKIRVFNSLLIKELGDNLSDQAKLYLQKMTSASERMDSMITGVLNYSGLNQLEHTQSEIDLNQILKAIENDLEVVISQKNAVIHYSNLPAVQGYGVLLHQLFYNLLNNALKFSRKDTPPQIVIRSQYLSPDKMVSFLRSECKDIIVPDSDQEYYVIEIEDNGIGFEPSEAKQIFRTFARLHSRDQYEGTGLGLALCKKIVERHNGFITANGKSGQGAVFYIFLPLERR
ncbi:PAS domain S-box protein [Xanthocytophaga agilis]|uniref:histidine kinase n=1 Tax=Xanthocytophaga agilis TaxID=3048010 RepID=A0AAE3UG84_9BACT|nr:PAS domain S-box protein [Xanthocytophaga agilis]MDJ1503026.1 PAS domain S-box protein [Xanthocytophaga agilis]